MGLPASSSDRGHTPAIALGAVITVWLVIYVTALPPGVIPVWLAAVVIVAALFGAGWRVGRRAGRGVAGGAIVGAAIGGLNLVIFSSRLGGDAPDEVMTEGLWWIAGMFGASVVLCAAGAAAGRSSGETRGANWTGELALLVAVATGILMVLGGVVTGLDAGLAIEGWLTSDGYVMVLYPLEMMTADASAFVEHAHRLWAVLVGLSAIILTVHLFLCEPRRGVRWLMFAAFVGVCIQGAMGGLRVTEESLVLAIAHGVFGQAVFATVACVAAVTSTTWIGDTPPAPHPRAAAVQRLTATLVAVFLVQLLLGALYRHLNAAPDVPRGLVHGVLGGHLLVAVLVTAKAIVVAARIGSVDAKPLTRTMLAMLVAITLQFVLGIVALVAVMMRGEDETATPLHEVISTTAHQANGALILALAVILAAWSRRLLSPAGPTSASGSAAA